MVTSRAGIDRFSSYVMELHERSLTHHPVALFQWSLEELALPSMPIAVGAAGPICTVPKSISAQAFLIISLMIFDSFWSEIKHEDLLARDVMGVRRRRQKRFVCVRCARFNGQSLPKPYSVIVTLRRQRSHVRIASGAPYNIMTQRHFLD